jgi:hypothetical protein
MGEGEGAHSSTRVRPQSPAAAILTVAWSNSDLLKRQRGERGKGEGLVEARRVRRPCRLGRERGGRAQFVVPPIWVAATHDIILMMMNYMIELWLNWF